MPDRVDRLERAVEGILRSLSDLDARIRALEAGKSRVPDRPQERLEPPAATPASPLPSPPSWTSSLPQAGRTFLVLGGAFLLRALTDAETWPAPVGVGLGLAYALVWIGLAHRDAARARPTSAALHGLAAVLVAYPLLFEAAVRFDVLSVVGAGTILALVTAIGLAVAWKGRLAAVAWWFVLFSTTTIVALVFQGDRPVFLGGLLVALGLATLVLAYGRRWGGPRWIVAVAANLAVLRVTSVAEPDPGAPALLVLYLIAYLGSFAIVTLVRRRTVGVFEMLQSAAVLLVGIGGAVHVARVAGSGGALVGISTLVAGALAYAAAFAFVRRRLGRGRNFFFYSTLGLVLVLTGSRLLGLAGFCTAVWGTLAVAAAFLGGRFDRVTLRAHSAVYAVATALQSGLFSMSVAELAGAASQAYPVSTWALPALACVTVSYGILAATRAFRKSPRLARIPRLVLAIVSLLGLMALVVSLVLQVAPESVTGNRSFVAAARSVVVAVAAVALALARKRTGLRELGWLSVALLAAEALKLLVEDLPAGGASALFVAFAFYGSALILVPRLLRPARVAIPEPAPR